MLYAFKTPRETSIKHPLYAVFHIFTTLITPFFPNQYIYKGNHMPPTNYLCALNNFTNVESYLFLREKHAQTAYTTKLSRENPRKYSFCTAFHAFSTSIFTFIRVFCTCSNNHKQKTTTQAQDTTQS